MYACVCAWYEGGAYRDHKKAPDLFTDNFEPSDLVAGNWTPILCMCSKCTYVLSNIFSPSILVLIY